MHLCHLFQRRVGVLGIGYLVVFLFRRFIAFCIMCEYKAELSRYSHSIGLLYLLVYLLYLLAHLFSSAFGTSLFGEEISLSYGSIKSSSQCPLALSSSSLQDFDLL